MMQLEQLRQQIQQIDEQILQLVAARMQTAELIAQEKKAQGLMLRNFSLEEEIVNAAAADFKQRGLNPQLATELMQLLIKHAVLLQQQIITTNNGKEEDNE